MNLGDASAKPCSFCGKSAREVARVIEGPRATICDECVGLCLDIMREEAEESAPPNEAGDPEAVGSAGDDRGAVVLVAGDRRRSSRLSDGEVWAAIEPHVASGMRVAFSLQLRRRGANEPAIMVFLERRRPRGGAR